MATCTIRSVAVAVLLLLPLGVMAQTETPTAAPAAPHSSAAQLDQLVAPNCALSR